MVDSLEVIVVVVVTELVPASIAWYAAYWAFSVWGALAGRIYRKHALLLGVTAFVFAMVGFLTYSTNQAIDDSLLVFYAAAFIFLFAFIDSTIPLARRSDPMLRSILGWDRLRVGLWGCVILLAGLNMFPAFGPALANSPFAASSFIGFLLENVAWPVVAGILFGLSGVALVVGARRSRDPMLRENLKWLGLVLLVVVLIFVADTSLSFLVPSETEFQFYYSYYALPAGLLLILATVFMYKAARSLVPLSRVPGHGETI